MKKGLNIHYRIHHLSSDRNLIKVDMKGSISASIQHKVHEVVLNIAVKLDEEK